MEKKELLELARKNLGRLGPHFEANMAIAVDGQRKAAIQLLLEKLDKQNPLNQKK